MNIRLHQVCDFFLNMPIFFIYLLPKSLIWMEVLDTHLIILKSEKLVHKFGITYEDVKETLICAEGATMLGRIAT